MTSKELTAIKNYYDSERGNRESFMYNYYTGKDVPVYSRVPTSSLKAESHTNVHEDFFKDIVDLKTGYMGQKINIFYQGENDIVNDLIKEDNLINNMSILNSDIIRKTTISGIAHRLVYTENGVIKYKNIGKDVGTVVYDYKQNPFDPDAAYFYYSTVDILGNKVDHCDVYTRTDVSYWSTTSESDYPDGFKGPNLTSTKTYFLTDSQPHNFNVVPIIPFINNDLWISDCDKVIASNTSSNRDGLMDVYDEILSDTVSEVKAMRLAYLKIHGTLYTGKDDEGDPISMERWLKQTSSMQFPMDDSGNRLGDAEFLEKTINDDIIENQLNRLRNAIYEKSGSIDIKNITDTSSQRVIGIKAQLMRLENTCALTESYTRAALYKQICMFSYWLSEYSNIKVDLTDFVVEFERVFPTDLEAVMSVATSAFNIMSPLDAYKIAGFEDAEAMAMRYEEYLGSDMYESEEDERIDDESTI